MSTDYTRNDVKRARDEIKAACPGAIVEDWQDYGFRLCLLAPDGKQPIAYVVYQPQRDDCGQEAIVNTASDAIAWWRSRQ